MKKICYRPVYNRKNRLNAQGAALLQVEAYLEKKKVYLSSHIYLKPEQWDEKRKVIKRHPNAESLNYMLREFMIGLEQKEFITYWTAPITHVLINASEEQQTSGSITYPHLFSEQ
jgi:hypothetical protein